MSDNELTCVPGIGPARAKRLNEYGVLTIEDLKNMTIEDLAAIKTIGMSNANKLKAAVHAMGVSEAISDELEVVHVEDEKTILEEMVQLIDPKSFKLVKKTRESLEGLHETINNGLEKLKPLGKKKWLKHYIEYKCQVRKLEKRLVSTLGELEDLSKKSKKTLEKTASNLEDALTDLWSNIKRKKFEKVNKELEAFRKALKSLNSKNS